MLTKDSLQYLPHIVLRSAPSYSSWIHFPLPHSFMLAHSIGGKDLRILATTKRCPVAIHNVSVSFLTPTTSQLTMETKNICTRKNCRELLPRALFKHSFLTNGPCPHLIRSHLTSARATIRQTGGEIGVVQKLEAASQILSKQGIENQSQESTDGTENAETLNSVLQQTDKQTTQRDDSLKNGKLAADKAEGNERKLLQRKPVPIEETYKELALMGIEMMGHLRLRQHVNPLQRHLMVPAEAPVWADVFADPTLPLFIDIGSASGRFTLVLAKRAGGRQNFLGLEIREKLVERSQLWGQEVGLRNVHFMVANATVSLPSLLSSYPGEVSMIAILCPDPHFKKRHHKRRVVQPALVDAVLSHLPPGGQIFLQSDVKEVAEDMKRHFQQRAGAQIELAAIHGQEGGADLEGWLTSNPLGVPSERETAVLTRGGSMYRLLYVRTKIPSSANAASALLAVP